MCYIFFFFSDTATTEIYTLSLHDALPIYWRFPKSLSLLVVSFFFVSFLILLAFSDLRWRLLPHLFNNLRSEEHTSELQSQFHLVCRLLLEKKKKNSKTTFKNMLDTITSVT